MADERPAASRSSRLGAPPTGPPPTGGANTFRAQPTAATASRFGFGSSTYRSTTFSNTTNASTSRAQPRTATFSAFGRTVTKTESKPRPSSAENTRLRQKPAGSIIASAAEASSNEFFSMASLGVEQAPRSTLSLTPSPSPSPVTSATTTTTTSLFSAAANASSITTSSTPHSASKPVGQLFSMDDTDLAAGEDDWGVDSPSGILSPASGTEEAKKPFQDDDDDFGWDDEAAAETTIITKTEVSQETVVTHEQPTPSEQPPAPEPVPAALSTAEFDYAADAGEAEESEWNDDGWGDDIAETETTLSEQLPVAIETSGPFAATVEEAGDEAPPAPTTQAAPTELAAVLSPTSAAAGEFWGDEEGALFSDEEPAQSQLPQTSEVESNAEQIASVEAPLSEVQAHSLGQHVVETAVQEQVQTTEFSYSEVEVEASVTETTLEQSEWDDDWSEHDDSNNVDESATHDESDAVTEESQTHETLETTSVEVTTTTSVVTTTTEFGVSTTVEEVVVTSVETPHVIEESEAVNELDNAVPVSTTEECSEVVASSSDASGFFEQTGEQFLQTEFGHHERLHSHEVYQHDVQEPPADGVPVSDADTAEATHSGDLLTNVSDASGFFGQADQSQHNEFMYQDSYAHEHSHYDSHAETQEQSYEQSYEHATEHHLDQSTYHHEDYNYNEDQVPHDSYSQVDCHHTTGENVSGDEQHQVYEASCDGANAAYDHPSEAYFGYASNEAYAENTANEEYHQNGELNHHHHTTEEGEVVDTVKDTSHVHHAHEQNEFENTSTVESSQRQVSWKTNDQDVEVKSVATEEDQTGVSFTKPDLSFGTSSFGAAELTFGPYHHDHHGTPSETEAGSVTSFAEVSSAGATFGGSDNASEGTYSDGGYASETRSAFGSSSAGTALVTEPLSSSEGSNDDVGPFDHISDASSAFGAGGGGAYSSEFDVSSTKSALFEHEVASTGFDHNDDGFTYGEHSVEHHYDSPSYGHDLRHDHRATSSDAFHATHGNEGLESPESVDESKTVEAPSPVPSRSSTPATYGAASSQDHRSASDLEFDHTDADNVFGSSPSDAFGTSPARDGWGSVEDLQEEAPHHTSSEMAYKETQEPDTPFSGPSEETEEVNPFAASGESSAFASSPAPLYSSPEVPPVAQHDEFIPSAASLFGSSPPKASPSSGFGGFGAAPSPPSHLSSAPIDPPIADAGDLFANASPVPGFGGYQQQPTQSASGFFGAAPSNSAFGNGFEQPAAQFGYDSPPPDAFGGSNEFSSGPAAESVFGSQSHSSYGGFDNAPAGDASSFFGGGASAADIFQSSDAVNTDENLGSQVQGAFDQAEYNHSEYNQSEYNQTEYNQTEYGQAQLFDQGDYTQEQFPHSEYGQGEFAQGEYAHGEFAQNEYAHGEFGHNEQSQGDFSQSEHRHSEFSQHEHADGGSGQSGFVDCDHGFGQHDYAQTNDSNDAYTAEGHAHSHQTEAEHTTFSSYSSTQVQSETTDVHQHETSAQAVESTEVMAAVKEVTSETLTTAFAESSSHLEPSHANADPFSQPPTGDSWGSSSATSHVRGTSSSSSHVEKRQMQETSSHFESHFGSETIDFFNRSSSAPPPDFGSSLSTSTSIPAPPSPRASSAPPVHSSDPFTESASKHAESHNKADQFQEQGASSFEESSVNAFPPQPMGDANASFETYPAPEASPFGDADTSVFPVQPGTDGDASYQFGAASNEYPSDTSAFFGEGGDTGAFGGYGGTDASGFFSSQPHHEQTGEYQTQSEYYGNAEYSGYETAAFGRHQSSEFAGSYTDGQATAAYPPQPVPPQHEAKSPSQSFGHSSEAMGTQYEASYSTSEYQESPHGSFPPGPPAQHHQPTHSRFETSLMPMGNADGKPAYNDYTSTAGQSYGMDYETNTQFNATATVHTSSKYKDPTMVVPSCLASFGFGGNVVTMFPKQKLRLNSAAFGARNSPRTPTSMQYDNGPHGELRKGPVGVYRMEHLHPKNKDFDELSKFPGPLHDGVAEDAILQFVDDKINAMSGTSPFEEDERLLLGILNVLIKCNGKLRSDPSANPNEPSSPEVQLVSLLKESDQRRRRNHPSSFPTPKPVQYPTHPDATVRNASRVRELLLLGDRKAAVDVAIQAQMWPEAMLIASFTDKDEYKRVLCAYFTSHYSPGDPCRALYLTFADQQEKSVHEPQKLMHTGQEESSSAILSSWVVHVQMLLANRTADTNKILIELGDRLWKEANAVVAAHICYLLAGNSVEAPSPSSKIALLGADHRAPEEARFYVSPSAVQRTEIYEWVQKKVNPAATNMIPFQGYKLIYAMILADHGKLETAFKYVNSMLTLIRAITSTMKPGTSMYLEGMQNQLVVLDDRLRQHLGQARADTVAAAANAKQGKNWGLGSALSIMGKIVNRVVEGNDAPPQAAAPTSSSGSLFQGAPLSNNNANSSPEYPSAAAIGYPTQPAPAPSSGRGGAPFGAQPQPPAYSHQPHPPHQSHQAPHPPQPSAVPAAFAVPRPPNSGRNSAPPYQPTPEYPAPLSGNGGNGFGAPPAPSCQTPSGFQSSAPPAAPLSNSSSGFQKPSLDLSGDAGKSSFGNDARRAPDMASKPKSPRSPRASDGPGSDKGSSSPKFKDTSKKAVRSKTPPPSRSSSGWLSGLSTFIAAKMNPEAKVAKLGEQMEAYFDEEKKRWVFPGETQAEEPPMPSAPPTGPLPGSTPSSSAGGPPSGPPGTHSAPGSMASASNDPLAALMAPPPPRSLMKKDPLAAMMAPPSRPMYGQRASTMPAKRPPRPQFAVFKPAPGSTSSAPGDQGPLSEPPMSQ